MKIKTKSVREYDLRHIRVQSVNWLLPADDESFAYVVVPNSYRYFEDTNILKFVIRETGNWGDDLPLWLSHDDTGFRIRYHDPDEAAPSDFRLLEFACGPKRILVHETRINVIYIHLKSS